MIASNKEDKPNEGIAIQAQDLLVSLAFRRVVLR